MIKAVRNILTVKIILLSILLAVVGITQTAVFKNLLRGFVIAQAPAYINGRLSIGALEGNLIDGFIARDVAVFGDDGLVFSARSAEVRYNPIRLMFGDYRFRRVVLTEPFVRIVRTRDSVWNVSSLFRETQSDSAPEPLKLEITQVQITDGTFVLSDSLAGSSDRAFTADSAFSYADIRVYGVNLLAGFATSRDKYKAEIQRLSALSLSPPFEVRNMRADLYADNGQWSVRNLELETGASRIHLSARLMRENILHLKKYAELGDARADVNLAAYVVDFRELRAFLPHAVGFLDSNAAAFLKGSGTYGTLKIENLLVHAGRSFVNGSGYIMNLHKPSELYLDVGGDENIVDPTVAMSHLPGLLLPDLRTFGDFRFSYSFKGTPLNFRSTVDGALDAGEVRADARCDFTKEYPTYEYTAALRSFNLGEAFDDPALASNLNVSVSAVGSSYDRNSMNAVIRAAIDSSRFNNLPLSRSVFVADIADGSGRGRLQLHAGHTSVNGGFTATYSSAEGPRYEYEASVNSLNLADVLGSDEYDSDLNLRLAGNSTSLDILSESAVCSLLVYRSVFGDTSIDTLHARLDTELSADSVRTTSLTSDIGSFELNGFYDLQDAGAVLVSSVRRTFGVYEHAVRSLRPLREDVLKEPPAPLPYAREPEINTAFSLTLRDHPIFTALLKREIHGSLEARGNVSSFGDDVNVDADVRIDSLVIAADSGAALAMRRGSLRFSITSLRGDNSLDSLVTSAQAVARECEIGGVRFSNADVRLDGDGRTIRHFASGLIDSTVDLLVSGELTFSGTIASGMIDNMVLGRGGRTYHTNESVVYLWGSDGMFIRRLSLAREGESLALAGYISPFGISDLQFNTLGINVREIGTLISPAVGASFKSLGGILTATGYFRGSLDHPDASVQFTVDTLTTGNVSYGALKGTVSVADDVLRIAGEFNDFSSRDTVSNLSISGVLPFGSAEREPDLTVHVSKLNLAILDPFIESLNSLKGNVNGSIRLRGSVDSPRLSGSVNVNGSSFYFEPLGMAFLANGSVFASGDSIYFSGFTVRNVPEDRADGSMNLSGSVVLSRYAVKSFSLGAEGQLQVMKLSSPLPGASVIGDVFAAVGRNKLNWKGTPERSAVRGEVSLRNAALTVPPTKQVELFASQDFIVHFVDDTASVGPGERVDTLSANARGSLAIGNNSAAKPVPPPPSEPASFFNTVSFDVTLIAEGRTQIRFVFNPVTNDELFADLKGRLNYTKQDNVTRFIGEVEASNQSYYSTFGKRFDASGKLLFTGDLLNPELEITAKYEGILEEDTVRSKQVTVIVDITGTLREPKTKMTLQEDGVQVQRPDVESDAIAFVLTGKYRDQLTQAERTAFNATVLSGLTNTLLAGPVNDYLRRQFGVTVAVLYYGGNFQEAADVRLTGSVGDAVVRFGGRVLNDISKANISVQLPMSSLMNSEAYRNLLLEVESRIDALDPVEQRRLNGLRLLYRFVF